jgi:hypothetical protein
MTHLPRKDNANKSTASITIGSDLKMEEFSAGWRAAGLPVTSGGVEERIDRLFPQADAAAYALDVLASGEPRENVVLQLGPAQAGRYLCADFYPLPLGAKPGKVKKVLMQGWETKAAFVLDSVSGAVLEAGKPTATMFARDAVDLTCGAGTLPAKSTRRVEQGDDAAWCIGPEMTEEEFEQALAAAERKGSQQPGRLSGRGDAEREAVESILMRIDGPIC